MADVEFSFRVVDDETRIVLTGERDAIVVVRSESGERIYLPPDDFADEPSDSPYQSASDSPYQSAERDDTPDDSPYQSARGAQSTRGMTRTPNGFRIVHPEPTTNVEVFR